MFPTDEYEYMLLEAEAGRGPVPTVTRSEFEAERLTGACGECGRVFDLLDEVDAGEWVFGHDCEVARVEDRHDSSVKAEEESRAASEAPALWSDAEAMNAIHRIMSGVEWSPDTLDEIGLVVEWSGREILPPE